MILSLFVAFIVTPWAAVKLLKGSHHPRESEGGHQLGRLDRLYQKIMESLLEKLSAALAFGGFSVLLLLLAGSLIYFKSVKVKMLPFDNKQEFQVLLDYPTSTSLATSQELSTGLATEILKHPEVEAVQVFAGEAAPYSFSGMVKHTFLRNQDFQNDLQVVLTGKGKRKASSHEIIESLRPLIKDFGERQEAVTKVLEIPPGPPVLATMIAEIYGPSRKIRENAAREIEDVFRKEPSVVDLDTTMRPGRARRVYEYDRAEGGLLGTNARELTTLGRLVFSETPVGTLSDIHAPEDVNIDLSIAPASRSSEDPLSLLRVPSFEAGSVEAEQALKAPTLSENQILHRKNLKPVSYVMSELSGAEEAPVYGILKLQPQIKYPVQTAEVPWNTSSGTANGSSPTRSSAISGGPSPWSSS